MSMIDESVRMAGGATRIKRARRSQHRTMHAADFGYAIASERLAADFYAMTTYPDARLYTASINA